MVELKYHLLIGIALIYIKCGAESTKIDLQHHVVTLSPPITT